MPRFFLPEGSFEGGEVTITGADARHISLSLRMAVGDSLTLCDMRRSEYECRIISMTRDSVRAEILSVKRSESEPPCFITLYQGIAKGEKMETIIQKSVELGVCRIVPVRSERCIAKIPADSEESKISRWRKIAAEAAGQSGRGIIPEVCRPLTFEQALEEMSKDSLSFVCYEGKGTLPLSGILSGAERGMPISFLIGPEGGLSEAETGAALEKGIKLAGIGKRILRTETAPLCVLSCIGLCFEY